MFFLLFFRKFKGFRGGEPIDGESVNRVKDVPENFKKWVDKNAERINNAKNLPYFLRDNHRESVIEYAHYKLDPQYEDVALNFVNGGVKATHVGHNFDKHRGWYETTVQDIGYKNGYRVVLGDESPTQYKVKNCEGTWNGLNFEIAAAENATPTNIRNALKHCASKPDCEVAVLFFPKKYSDSEFEEGLKKYNGLKGTSQYRMFKRIICIYNGKVVKEIS